MSLSKAQQSRINGAKSHGPKTPEGKARSSMNAIKHGRFATNAVVLSNEDPLAFEALVADYVQRIQPADPVEYHYARELASLDWRLARIRALDTRLLDHEMELQALAIETSGHHLSELTRLLHASRTVVDRSRYPAFLARRESQLLQARVTTFRALRALRKDCPPADPALVIVPPRPLDPDSILPNEPGTNQPFIPNEPGLQPLADIQFRPQASPDAPIPSRPPLSPKSVLQPRRQTSPDPLVHPRRKPRPRQAERLPPVPSAPRLAGCDAPNAPVELPVQHNPSPVLPFPPASSEEAA